MKTIRNELQIDKTSLRRREQKQKAKQDVIGKKWTPDEHNRFVGAIRKFGK